MENTSAKKLKALEERSKRLKVDFIDLAEYPMDHTLTDLLSFTFARQYTLIPVKMQDGHLMVAMEDPTNLYLKEQLEIRTKKKIMPILADSDDIVTAIKSVYAEVTPDDIKVPMLDDQDFQQVAHMISDNTISWFRSVLTNAIKRDVSEVHIETYENEIRVRYRIDGIIAETATMPRQMESQLHIFIKSLTRMKLEKKHVPQEGFFEIKLRERKLMVRVATLPTRLGERFIMKITDEQKMLKSLDELGFNEAELKLIKDILHHRQGLVIVAGPAGNGLSTTLYSMLLHVARPEFVGISIEDPVEAPLPGINQMEVNPRLELSYKECVRQALRHSPDIIMLARTKEAEVAHLIIEAALTGRMALAGVHARDSIDAISRLRDFGIEPYFLSTPLLGVISQRLARTVCPNCAEPVRVSPEIAAELQKNGIPEPYNLKTGKGCNQCLNTGFKGRIGIYEVLPVSESFKSMILRGSTKFRLAEQATRDGMMSLQQDGLRKVALGLTTYDEIQRVLID